MVEKVKKEFDMPGQRYDTPDEVRGALLATLPVRSPSWLRHRQTDGCRKFYTSLREQKPSSRMAEEWLMTRGLLDRVRLQCSA